MDKIQKLKDEQRRLIGHALNISQNTEIPEQYRKLIVAPVLQEIGNLAVQIYIREQMATQAN